MSKTYVGLFAGLLLGIVAVTLGFLAFLAVAFLGALGLVIGMIFDGHIDVGSWNRPGRSRS